MCNVTVVPALVTIIIMPMQLTSQETLCVCVNLPGYMDSLQVMWIAGTVSIVMSQVAVPSFTPVGGGSAYCLSLLCVCVSG